MLQNGGLNLEGGPNGAGIDCANASKRSFEMAGWPYSLDAVIREASKLALVRALQATQGNCHRAAELLGVSRYTVYRMLNRFGVGESHTHRTLRKPTVFRAEKRAPPAWPG